MAVSWLIPVRDGAAGWGRVWSLSLRECSEHDEVVVVDDGSTDFPRAVCPDDSRISWLTQPPLGIVAALEHGRRACRHPLIARLDADDVALPGRIAAQTLLMQTDSRLAVVGGKAEMVREDNGANDGMKAYVEWVNSLRDHRAALLVESPVFHPAVLMRADAEAVGGTGMGTSRRTMTSGFGWRCGLQNYEWTPRRANSRPSLEADTFGYAVSTRGVRAPQARVAGGPCS